MTGLTCRIESRRLDDDAVDVRRAVAPLGAERFRCAPAGGGQRGQVGALEIHDDFAVGGAPQLRDGREIDARPRVHVIAIIRREAHLVIAIG
jgi:hypothetical protein